MLRFLLITMSVAIIFSMNTYAADKSLILYLPFDDGSGEVAEDLSDNKNDGTIFGNATWADGKENKCLNFASGSYVKVSEIPAYDVSAAISLMGWVNTTTVTTWARIIDKSQWQDNGFDLALSQATHAPLFEFFVNNTTSQALAITKVDDGKWHFIVGTFGNKKLRIYVDGVMEQEVTSVGNVDIKLNDWPIMIGVEANNGTGQPYVGKIDEIAIFNRELSADEIQDIYQNGVPVSSSSVEPGEKMAITWGMIKD